MSKFKFSELIVPGFIILVIIVLSPIWFPFYLYFTIISAINSFRFSRFVRANDGAKYFCYTIRQNSVEFVRENIVPNLPAETSVIFITDQYDNLGDSSKFTDEIIGRMGGLKKGFPCIAKFSNGQMLIESVNHEVYHAIDRKRGAEKVMKKIDKFFSEELLTTTQRQR